MTRRFFVSRMDERRVAKRSLVKVRRTDEVSDAERDYVCAIRFIYMVYVCEVGEGNNLVVVVVPVGVGTRRRM